ncbi:unnamed protein product [Peniophora sp. CBMAI 1063]|nr:unnamed protein product [Peniophora sp. CBMAI 1063]
MSTLSNRRVSMPVIPSHNTWPRRALTPPPPSHLKPGGARPPRADVDYAVSRAEERSGLNTWTFDISSEERVQAFLDSHLGFDGRVQTLCWVLDFIGGRQVLTGDRVIKRVSCSLEVSAVVDAMLGHDTQHAVFSLRIDTFHEKSRTVHPSGPLYAYLVIGRDRVSDIYKENYRLHFHSYEPIYPRLLEALAAVSDSMRGGDEAGDGTYFRSAIIQHFISSFAMRFFSCEVDSGRAYLQDDLNLPVGHNMHSRRAVESLGSVGQLAFGYAGDMPLNAEEEWHDLGEEASYL